MIDTTAVDKPNVVISKCINIEAVRYDGGIIRDRFAELLGKHVNYLPVCPEVGIGLGIPRATLRLVKDSDGVRLVQPLTGLDFTEAMNAFSEGFLDSLTDVDGFLLKSRSPSSGASGVRVYQSADKTAPVVAKAKGLFAARVCDRFPELPVEDEGRLADAEIRNHFLIRLFVLHEFKVLCRHLQGMRDLVDFQTRHKMLLSTYSQKWTRELGRIIANHERRNLGEVARRCREALCQVFSRKASYRAHINTLLHALGYFAERISGAEKRHFLVLLDKYGNGWVPLTVPLEVIRSFIHRFQEDYLLKQSYFSPYAEELLYFR